MKDIIAYFLTDLKAIDYGISFIVGIVLFAGYILYIKFYKKQTFTVQNVLLGIVFAGYIAILFGGTILNREMGEEYQMKLRPFWSYQVVIEYKDYSMLWQIVSNVLVFIPWGFLSAKLWDGMKKFGWNLYCSFMLSVIIEGTQLVCKFGLFELDDILHNVLGAVIGYMIWRLWNKITSNRKRE